METPILPPSHYFEYVYEPAEDSFLLLDALEADLPNVFKDFSSHKEGFIALEVGCGSGVISTALANYQPAQHSGIDVIFAVDINPKACYATKELSQLNKVSKTLETITLDGSRDVASCFRTSFDLIVCNPPYVPVLPEENKKDEIDQELQKSWDGGPDGNKFIVPFLRNVFDALSDHGVLYILLSKWNNPESVVERTVKTIVNAKLKASKIMKRSAGQERLEVWKIQKFLTYGPAGK